MTDIGKASHQRITWFYQRYKENSLDLAPPFQRKPVWALKNKSYLIDTIIKGLPIPEIYMQVKTDRDGNTKYIVVDGQQRIRAILDYLDGQYDLLEEDNPEYGNKEFKELPDGVKKEIWDYTFVVRELSNTDEEVRHIFQRLNKNVVPLNKQELRNATYTGHFINLVNRLAEEQEFFSENGIFSPNDIKRMKDAEFISELLVSITHGIQNKDDTLDNYYQMYDTSFSDKEEKKREFSRILNLIEDIFGSLKSTRFKIKSDFLSLFYCLYELNKEYIIPAENYQLIKDTLFKFSDEVIKNGEESKNILIRDYAKSIIAHTNDKLNRENRNKILRSLIIPFLIARDKKRQFSEEERMIAWANSNKKCAICGKKVEWDSYELDHIMPHSKGGYTELKNAQITHKSCNIEKSNK